MSDREEEPRQHAAADPQAREFLALLAALPWLLRQYFADSLDLLETEGRLALRGLLMIVALTLCLAGLIAGSWLVLMVFGVYWLAEAGVAPWAIAVGVVLLHILVFAGLARQLRSLARYLFFPNSRRVVANLIGLSRPYGP